MSAAAAAGPSGAPATPQPSAKPPTTSAPKSHVQQQQQQQQPEKAFTADLAKRVGKAIKALEERRASGVDPQAPLGEDVVKAWRALRSEVERIVEKQRAEELPPLPEKRDLGKLKAWLVGLGAEWSGVDVDEEAGVLRAAAAAPAAPRADKMLLRIPFKACIVAREDFNPDEPKSFLTRVMSVSQALRPTGAILLALMLLEERRLGAKSAFAPYVNSLPRSFDMVAFVGWSPEEAMALGPMLAATVLRRWATVVGFYASAAADAALRPMVGTLKDFMWSIGVVSSRQNPCKYRTRGKYQEVEGFALIPGLDMLNHDPAAGPDKSTAQDLEDLAFETKAWRDFAPGEELTIFYGKRSDEEFLMYQGFVPTYVDVDANANASASANAPPSEHAVFNENTIVALRLPYPGNDNLAKARAATLRNDPGVAVLDDHIVIPVGGSVGALPAVNYARACLAKTKEDVAQLVRAKVNGGAPPTEGVETFDLVRQTVEVLDAFLKERPVQSPHVAAAEAAAAAEAKSGARPPRKECLELAQKLYAAETRVVKGMAGGLRYSLAAQDKARKEKATAAT